MLPTDNTIYDGSTGEFLYALPVTSLKESSDMGGVAVNDTSQGLARYLWQCRSENNKFYLRRQGEPEVELPITGTDVTAISLTFDQNMNICLAYIDAGMCKLYWYDTSQAQMTISDFPGIDSPRVSLDDRRSFAIASSDILFVYLKGQGLYYRMQRERYLTEHLLKADVGVVDPILRQVGMGKNNRFLFHISSKECFEADLFFAQGGAV